MLKGIDVSSHQGYPLTGLAATKYNSGDFVIVKATQGTHYINPTCDPVIQQAIKDKKLWGFYHYAESKDPVAEAEYFVKNCKNYFGKGIPAIDWEQEQNSAYGSTTWVKKFVDRVHELTGVWCVIYTGRYQIPQVQNCVNNCGLWLAEWGVSTPGNITPWDTWTIWQWTSTNGVLDQNYFNGTKAQWQAIAKGEKTTENKQTTKPTAKKQATATITSAQAIDRMARDVISGKYGVGQARKDALYNTIQKRVNELCK